MKADDNRGSDGSVYVADWLNARVRRITPDGIITTFAGGGSPTIGNGDGGLATEAELGGPTNLAFGPDGSLYISDSSDGRIRRVASDGTISTFAGGGNPADGLGDGLLATQAELDAPGGLSIGPNGTVYVADTGHNRVRTITADGIITTLAGGGTPSPDHGDGEMGPNAVLATPRDVVALADGSVLIADSDHDRIRRVDASGEMSTFAGTGIAGYSGDGGPATSATVGAPTALAVDTSNGRVMVAQDIGDVVRSIDSEGIITTLAGTGTSGYSGDQGPPAAATLRDPQGLAVGPDHEIFVADTNNFRVRVIDAAMPGFATTDILVPSMDGSELYHFDKGGRHLRTLDALTGVATATFGYDDEGHLLSVTDAYGNATLIDRNANGVATAIVSPFGQRTELNIDANGRLASVTNPAAETVSMAYVSDGLLESFTTASGSSTFTYDSTGRLIVDNGPGPGSTILDRTEIPRGHRVTVTSPAERATTYETEKLPSGNLRRTITQPWGGVTRSIARADGTVELTSEDGTTVTSTLGPDPRFGMMTSIPSSMTTRTPAAREVTMTFARSTTLSDPSDPLTLTAQTDSVTANNRTVTRVYDAGDKTLATTSAEGRQGTVTFNPQGSVLKVTAGGLAPVSFTYDTRGRVETIIRGSGAGARTTTLTYDASGFLDAVTNPLSETASFDYDGVGRVTTQTLSDSNAIAFDYDGVGNLVSLTPPGRGAHSFRHDSRDLLELYSPPSLSGGATETTYAYTDDKQVDSMTLPTTEVLDHQYDGAGRLDGLSFSRGLIDYAYTASTAQLASVSAPGGIGLTYSFDGPLLTGLSATGDAPGTVSYGYDADLRVSSRTINGGNSSSYTYDKDGLIKTAGALTLNWGATSGLLATTSLGSVSTTHGYNGFGEPETMAATYSGSDLYSVSYTRDNLGRIDTKTETSGGTTTEWDYDYDKRGRLTEVKKDGAAHASYTYDANGNRESVTEGGSTTYATFDAQDRLISQGSSTYQYSADGQLSSKTVSSVTTTYDYDELGSLMDVASPSKTVTYVVDGQGRRVARKVDGTITNRYLYGQEIVPVAELNADGSVKSQFVYATKTYVPDFMIKNGVTYRFVTDQVGSVRLVVNTSDGTIAQRIDYDPYGKVLSDTNPGFQPFGFAGGLNDPDTGLTRFGLRDYDAEIGRWTAKDPILFDGGDTNLYAYVYSDPVNLIDPTGELAFIPIIVGAWAVIEVGLAVTDAISTASTLADPCATGTDKLLSGGLFIIGALTPGGGYSTGAKYGDDAVRHVDEVVDWAGDWLGSGRRIITNKHGDKIFISDDGLRRIRVDINNTHPHPSPHMHIEELIDGRWKKSGPIYPGGS